MSYDRCGVCLGRKQILGFGNMYKDCVACHGVGYVKPAPVVVATPASSVVKIDKRTRAYKEKVRS